jgi:CheY-like chemotaxis protein
MGGEVGVLSKHGKGSTFWFSAGFGVPAVQQELILNDTSKNSNVVIRDYKSRKPEDIGILLVEDNPGNQKVGMRLLEKGGFRVDLVNNGRKAVEAFQKNDYDIIFMDMLMPVLDGFGAIKKIRRLESMALNSAKPDITLKVRSRIPIVSLTARAVGGSRASCLEAGADEYLPKPVRKKELYALIEKLTGVKAKKDENDSAPVQPVTNHLDEKKAEAKKTLRILIADDSWSMRKILIKHLKQSGYSKIRACANGFEALREYTNSGADLIISDWNMPIMNGLEFLQKVRAGEAGNKVPFIMATAEGLNSNIDIAKKAGVTDYLIKPFKKDEINDLIQCIFS